VIEKVWRRWWQNCSDASGRKKKRISKAPPANRRHTSKLEISIPQKKELIMIRTTTSSLLVVLAMANFAIASVNVDVNTPNVRVNVGNPPPPPPPVHVRVGERERIVEKEHYRIKDNGKHKGHYKKKFKHNKHDQY
jgi:hypothetical protein